jgi:hypothetical protein
LLKARPFERLVRFGELRCFSAHVGSLLAFEVASMILRERVTDNQQLWSKIPYPDGDANPQDELEVLVQRLDEDTFTAEALSRVDDLLVHALMDKKRPSNRPGNVVNVKFTAAEFDASTGSGIAWLRNSLMPTEAPLSDWEANAEKVWHALIAAAPNLLDPDLKGCFCK